MGDYVNIAVNGTFHKGMPHKFYHGRTGIVYNVSRRAVGVELNKQVRNRIVKKRISVRVEHVQPSTCRIDFLQRVKRNEELKRAAKKSGKPVALESIKRFPVGPKPGMFISAQTAEGTPQFIKPAPFDDML
jgi:large subunit ribosomal protein L21e